MAVSGFRSAAGLTARVTSLLKKQASFSKGQTLLPVPCMCMTWERCESSSSKKPAVQTKQLSANILLKTLQDDPVSSISQDRPLVLLFGWMLAKQRHMDKYGNLYHSKGFDVLSLKMKPGQVLIPQRAQATVEEIIKLLLTPELRSRPLMVHGFSVGGYMYGEYLVKLEENAQMYADVRERMVGQIFDSPVDFEGVPSGFANVLSKNAVGKAVIQKTLEAYLRLMEKPVTSHYIRASRAFHDNSLRLPSLMLYSRSDPIGVHHKIDNVIELWKRENIPVMSKCWESSPHVSHFHRHPDEYVEAVLKFLDSTGLSKQAERLSTDTAKKEAEAQIQ